jgi:membrane protease YdiL (CAAX protease family)
MSPRNSLLCVTSLFSVLHFLKPRKDAVTSSVEWLSGFQLLPGAFHQFAEPGLWLASFSTIFVLGWVLGMARQQTRSLWLSIGFHAGIVFVKMSFNKLTERHHQFLPWVGPELQIGLVPVAILLACGWVLWRQLQHAQHGELGEKGRDNGADNPAGTSIR